MDLLKLPGNVATHSKYRLRGKTECSSEILRRALKLLTVPGAEDDEAKIRTVTVQANTKNGAVLCPASPSLLFSSHW